MTTQANPFDRDTARALAAAAELGATMGWPADLAAEAQADIDNGEPVDSVCERHEVLAADRRNRFSW